MRVKPKENRKNSEQFLTNVCNTCSLNTFSNIVNGRASCALHILCLQAMKKQEAHEKKVEKFMAMDERKRPYNIMYDFKEPTEEEMEAFRRKKLRSDDPMAQFS